MISFVKGELIAVSEGKIIVECNGMGFNIFIPATTVENLPAIGQEVKIHTYLNVKEDAMNLYGFLDEEQLEMFKMLITVNGVGPKGALGILTLMTVNELRIAIATDDSKSISKAQGIGSKTAQKVIIELKSKVDLETAIDNMTTATSNVLAANDEERTLAVQALIALGYSSTEATKAVKKVPLDIKNSDDIIKAALRELF